MFYYCVLVLVVTVLLFFFKFNKKTEKLDAIVASGVETEKANKAMEVIDENSEMVLTKKKNNNQVFQKQKSYFDAADVMTLVGRRNTCVGIFKNPVDHKTHFYKTRFKAKDNKDNCPLEFRNIAAAIRLWGNQWESISHIKISEKECSVFEQPSKWVSRLEDQREDCQNKFGCRVDFLDFQVMKDAERRVFRDLGQKIHDCCISEDDLVYFNLQDDTFNVHKTYFDL